MLSKKCSITQCKFSEGNCIYNKNLTFETKIAEAHSALKEAVLRYENILDSTKEDLDFEQQHIKDFIEDEFDFITETVKTHISDSEAKIKKTFHLADKGTIQQKVRVCEVKILILSNDKSSF